MLSTLSRFLNDKQKIANFLRQHRSRAADVESALEVAGHLADVLVSDSPGRKQALIADLLSRVTVTKTSLKISVKPTQLRALLSGKAAPSGGGESEPDILLEAQFSSSTGGQQATKLLIEDRSGRRSEPDPVVVKAVARARWWFEQLVTGKAQSMAEIAARDNITDNYVSNLIHLAWLPPHQIDLILEGDPTATQLAKNSMLTRNVNIIWRVPGRAHGRR